MRIVTSRSIARGDGLRRTTAVGAQCVGHDWSNVFPCVLITNQDQAMGRSQGLGPCVTRVNHHHPRARGRDSARATSHRPLNSTHRTPWYVCVRAMCARSIACDVCVSGVRTRAAPGSSSPSSSRLGARVTLKRSIGAARGLVVRGCARARGCDGRGRMRME